MESSEKHKNKDKKTVESQVSNPQADKNVQDAGSPVPSEAQFNPKASKKSKFQGFDNQPYHKIQNKFQNNAASRLAFKKKSSKGR